MAMVPSLRASDSDREQVAERLRTATVEGRLDTDELEERLEALYSSRTYGELAALTADLPVTRPAARARNRLPMWVVVAAAVTLLLAVVGMLASAAHHSAEAVRAFPGALAHPHHVEISEPSRLGFFLLLAVGAMAFRLVMRSRHR